MAGRGTQARSPVTVTMSRSRGRGAEGPGLPANFKLKAAARSGQTAAVRPPLPVWHTEIMKIGVAWELSSSTAPDRTVWVQSFEVSESAADL